MSGAPDDGSVEASVVEAVRSAGLSCANPSILIPPHNFSLASKSPQAR